MMLHVAWPGQDIGSSCSFLGNALPDGLCADQMSDTCRQAGGGRTYAGDASPATETTGGTSHAMSGTPGPASYVTLPNARSGDATLSAEVIKRRLVGRISAWLTVRLLAAKVGSFFRSARKNATKAISTSTAITPTTIPATAAGSVESSEPVLPPAPGAVVVGDTVGAAVAGIPKSFL